MTRPLAWPDVMKELTGLRLAVHDQLLNSGALDVRACAAALAGDGASFDLAALAEAIAWLARHRLLVAEFGMWRAVLPGAARLSFEMSGEAAQPEAESDKPKAPPVERGRTATVQKHQVEFFCNEGYREANGSL